MQKPEPIDLFNTPCALPGVYVDDVTIDQSVIQVTSHGDGEPKYVKGLKKIIVTLNCSPEGFKSLAATLTGVNPDDKPEVMQPEVMVEQHRSVKLA